jgi:hypothetical protein
MPIQQTPEGQKGGIRIFSLVRYRRDVGEANLIPLFSLAREMREKAVVLARKRTATTSS